MTETPTVTNAEIIRRYKVGKLADCLYGMTFRSPSGGELRRLEEQLEIIDAYSDILHRRVEKLGRIA